MRISAGKLKGRKIASKKARHRLRPTSSKVRESIFNIIGSRIEDSIFADLYAGTGAIGIEAISRGSQLVYFIEADRKRAEQIQKTLKDYNCSSNGKVIAANATDFIRGACNDNLMFDIIFLDPPYYSDELDVVLSLLSGGEILNKGGIILAEHHSKKRFPDEIGILIKKKTYKYGDTMLALFGDVR
jgi:16S rRNA (guanine(966)-N(2))-methyltransferase RsmD